MPGLAPGIAISGLSITVKKSMAGTSPAMKAANILPDR